MVARRLLREGVASFAGGPGAGPRDRWRCAERSERCAVQAGLRGDPMLGTAFPASRLLLVEQPGPWGRAGLLDSRFDRAVAHRLIGRMTRRDPGAGHPPTRPDDRWPAAAVGGRRTAARIENAWYGGSSMTTPSCSQLDVSRGDPASRRAPAPATRRPTTAPVFAVCAHGTHDVCCAIRGRPVAAALDRCAPGGSGSAAMSAATGSRPMCWCCRPGCSTAGSSHPRRRRWSRPPTSAACWNSTCVGGRGFAPEVQAAMVHGHREHARSAVFDVRVVGEQAHDLASVVRLRVAGELVEVGCGPRRQVSRMDDLPGGRACSGHRLSKRFACAGSRAIRPEPRSSDRFK